MNKIVSLDILTDCFRRLPGIGSKMAARLAIHVLKMPDAKVETHSTVRYAIIGEGSTVHANSRIGDNPQFYDADKWGIAVVGKDKEVMQNATILPKEIY